MSNFFLDTDFEEVCKLVLKKVGKQHLAPQAVLDSVTSKGYSRSEVRQALWHLVDTGELDFTVEYQVRRGKIR